METGVLRRFGNGLGTGVEGEVESGMEVGVGAGMEAGVDGCEGIKSFFIGCDDGLLKSASFDFVIINGLFLLFSILFALELFVELFLFDINNLKKSD